MKKKVVGWGWMVSTEKCDYCGSTKREGGVYVEDDDMMKASCKSCTPPNSCKDEIGEVLGASTPRIDLTSMVR